MDLLSTTFFNVHMHKMGPQGPKHYIFGDHFYSTIARKIRFYLFLHFSARKYTISLFYLKWTKFPRDCDILPVQFGSPGTHSWNKTHNILWIQTTSGKMMNHIFLSKKKEKYVESELSGIFRVKVLTKNMVFGSLGTQCKTAFAVWCKKDTNFLTKL